MVSVFWVCPLEVTAYKKGQIGLLEEEKEGEWVRNQSLGTGVEREGRREREKEKEMGGRQGPLKRDRSECAQEVLPVAAAEDESCRDPKGSQCRCLNTGTPHTQVGFSYWLQRRSLRDAGALHAWKFLPKSSETLKTVPNSILEALKGEFCG